MLKYITFTICLIACLPIFANAQTWAFDVYLDKQKIGTHAFEYSNNQLKSQAAFKVKLLGITVYDYQHQAIESWQNGCLTGLEANTKENSEKTIVKGAQNKQAFELIVNNKPLSLPSCVMTFAYWNPEILKQNRLLNPQNAEYLDVTVEAQGSKNIAVKDQNLLSTQYVLKGKYQGKDKLNITLWYSPDNDWLGLESTTPEGRKITYKLR